VASLAILILLALVIRQIVGGWRYRTMSRNAILIALTVVGNGWFSVLVCNSRLRRYLFNEPLNDRQGTLGV